MTLPPLIQGGMGAGVSGWALARAVATEGQLGVVSGTALDTILIRRLQNGDADGQMRRALAAFPIPGISQAVLEKYFIPANADRVEAGSPRYKLATLLQARMSPEREALIVLANFVEIFLSKDGHEGMVGINYLEKIQMATLPSLYGAMLAGVDVVLMGAGIPSEIPAVLDRFVRHERVSISLDVLDAGTDRFELTFDPMLLWSAEGPTPPTLRRPAFLPIVASSTLARALLKKAPGGIDGFVVEGPIAGGHNAPPRGELKLSALGEPVYGVRDEVDPAQMVALGVPFWLAGGQATRERLAAARACGAHGIQAGTVFAFCEESGLTPEIKDRVLAGVMAGKTEVFTDPVASPTGFPFKVLALEGTLFDPQVYAERPRLCDLGYLRRAYRKADGTLGYRCPGEPVDDYVRKGGKAEETVGRKCLCNALVANIGFAQRRADGYEEPPMLTAGNDLDSMRAYITPQRRSYSAKDVINGLLAAG